MEKTELILVIIAIAVVAFIVLRELWLWYFKINERVKLLESLLHEQKRTNRILDTMDTWSENEDEVSMKVSE